MKKENNRIQQRTRQRQKMSAEMIIGIAAFSILLTTGLLLFFEFGSTQQALAISTGDYRSKASGNWNVNSTWERFNGTDWVLATTPTASDKVITIQSGHTVTVTANVSVDDLIISSGGQISVSTGTLTIANGGGTDLTVNGTLEITSTLAVAGNSIVDCNSAVTLKTAGTVTVASGGKINVNGRFKREGGTMPTTTGIWTINTGGIFEHNMNGGVIPTATWNTGSTCEITGVTTTLPTGLTQTFKNFTWNCPGQSATLDNSTALKNISGDLTIVSTGNSVMFFDQQGNNLTMTVGGNFNVQGGTVYMCENGSDIMNIAGNLNVSSGLFSFCRAGATAYGNTSGIINLTGNLNVTGGSIDMSQYTGNNSGKGVGIINIQGNVTLTSPGIITETENSRGQIYFCGTAIQTCSSYNLTTNNIDFTVNNGATLRCTTNIINSTGNFTVIAGGHLMIGLAEGITLTSLSGNIQCTGTRTYSTGADYTYEGTMAQVSGDGLPSITRNLTLNNSNNLTLSGSTGASALLTLTSGKIITGSYEIKSTNTSTASIVSYSTTNYIVGNLRRSVVGTGAYIFPLGTMTYYEPATLTLAAATGFTDVLGFFNNAAPVVPGYPLSVTLNGTPITRMLNYGYWTFTPGSAMSGGTYTISLSERGYTNIITDVQSLCVLKRANVSSSWQSTGTHSNLTQSVSNGVATAVRSVLNAFSDFGIGEVGSGGILPVELVYFRAASVGNSVRLEWETSAEINNDYFTVERSSDGRHFESLLSKPGAGNSTTRRFYSANDDQPIEGKSYYRLRQTDYDGRTVASDPQVVNTNPSHKTGTIIQSISPSPFSDHFKVNFTEESDGAGEFSLANSGGQTVYSEKIVTRKGSNILEFRDRKNLPEGIYYARITVNEQSITQKIVKGRYQ